MVSIYRVRITRTLRDRAQTWPPEDQDVLLGLMDALGDYGFDVICGAATSRIAGLTVEFIEPGEIPEMVWARIFLDLTTQYTTLVIRQSGSDIVLEAG